MQTSQIIKKKKFVPLGCHGNKSTRCVEGNVAIANQSLN